MENGRQFRINVYTRGVGEQVTLDVRRGQQRLQVRAPVVERAGESGRLVDLVTPANTVRALGILGLDLTPPIAELLPPVRGTAGVVVAAVSAGSPYSQQGRLEAGDVIYSLNGRTIGGIADLRAAADALQPAQAAVLQVEREGTLRYFAFRVEK
jgi:S1-C subfamily serine protease